MGRRLRHGNVVQTQIDAKLRAVVDQVVEEHVAEGQRARAVGEELLAVGELPRRGEVGVGGGHQRGACLGCQRVEVASSFLRVLKVISGHLAVVRSMLGVSE